MQSQVIANIATAQEIVVGQATPATPARSTNTPMISPTMLIRLLATVMYIVVRVRPLFLNMAAPALYNALRGREKLSMNRQVSAASITSGVTFQ